MLVTKLAQEFTVKFFILYLMTTPAWGFTPDPSPFWNLPKNQARLEKREVLVSVQNEDGRTWMKGVGFVRTTPEKAFRFAQDYGRLASLKNHFSDIRFEPSTQTLSLTAHVLFRTEKLKFRMKPQETETQKILGFEVLEGMGQGSEGALVIQDLKRQESVSEISLQGVMPEGKKYSWVFNLGVEAVLKHVANSLRSQLEQEASHVSPL